MVPGDAITERVAALTDRVARLEREQDAQGEIVQVLREGFASLRAELRVWVIVLGLAAPAITAIVMRLMK